MSQAHTHTDTRTVHVLRRTDTDRDLCTKLTLTMKNLFPYFLSHVPECRFSQRGPLGFSSAHSHYSLLSRLEKYHMFSQTVEIHLCEQTIEGFQDAASRRVRHMENRRTGLMIQQSVSELEIVKRNLFLVVVVVAAADKAFLLGLFGN